MRMEKVFKFATKEEKAEFISDNCPEGYGGDETIGCGEVSCVECWEKSGIKLVVEETEDTEEENKEMAVKLNKTVEEQIMDLQAMVAELKEEQKKLEKYKSYKDTADEIAAMRSAFVDAGFSDDEAFTLVSGMVDKVIGAAIKRYL